MRLTTSAQVSVDGLIHGKWVAGSMNTQRPTVTDFGRPEGLIVELAEKLGGASG